MEPWRRDRGRRTREQQGTRGPNCIRDGSRSGPGFRPVLADRLSRLLQRRWIFHEDESVSDRATYGHRRQLAVDRAPWLADRCQRQFLRLMRLPGPAAHPGRCRCRGGWATERREPTSERRGEWRRGLGSGRHFEKPGKATRDSATGWTERRILASCVSNRVLRCNPPSYPVSLPPAPITR